MFAAHRFIQGGWVNDGNFADTAVPVAESESADVYVLSIPSFQWLKVNNPSGGARAYGTCHTTGNNQMILVGGFNYTNSIHPRYDTPDPWTQQLAVFDMTALQWKDKYEASADPYVTPERVKLLYANS